jgi:hypothetical protein
MCVIARGRSESSALERLEASTPECAGASRPERPEARGCFEALKQERAARRAIQ